MAAHQKNGKKKIQKEAASSVKFEVSFVPGNASCAITDIDVPPGVKEVALGVREAGVKDVSPKDNVQERVLLDRKKGGKTFPDVETLVIGERMVEVRISNRMFPNVRRVVSKNKRFRDGKYLIQDIQKDTLASPVLLNAFCHRDGEMVDVSGVRAIADGAFAGCGKIKLMGTRDVLSCRKAAFPKEMLREESGVYMAGTILADVEDGIEEIIVPAETMMMANDALDGEAPKKLDVSAAPEMLAFMMNNCPKSIKTLRFDIPVGQLWHMTLMAYVQGSGVDFEAFEVPESSARYRCIDGMLFSKDGEKLIMCPAGRGGQVRIPYGTKKITTSAFFRTGVTEVEFPDTLEAIESSAFAQCEIERFVLPASVKEFGRGNFWHAREIIIEGGRPIEGLMKAIMQTANKSAPTYVIVDMAGFQFAVPYGFKEAKAKKFVEAWKGGKFDKAAAEKLYVAADNTDAKQDTALAELSLHPEDGEARAYLKRVAGKMMARYLEGECTEGLMMLLSLGVLGADAARRLVDEAGAAGLNDVKAYALGVLEGAEVKTPGIRL